MARLPKRIRSLLAVNAVALLTLGAVVTADLNDAELQSVRGVVQSQLDAITAGDADRAFALADPQIRRQFGSAERFMAMLQAHYPMVHRPASVLFLKPEGDSAMMVQRLLIADASGSNWIATYILQRQHDRQWRISACVVTPEGPHVTT